MATSSFTPSPAMGRRTPPGRAAPPRRTSSYAPRTSSLRPEGWPGPPPKSLAVGESNRKPMGENQGKTMGKTMKSHGSYQGCSHGPLWYHDPSGFRMNWGWTNCCAYHLLLRMRMILRKRMFDEVKFCSHKWISIYFCMFKLTVSNRIYNSVLKVRRKFPRNLWGWLWPTPEALWSAKQKWSTKNLGRTYVIYLPLSKNINPNWMIYWFNISGWWLTYPSEKYESQLGWWHSQYMESHKIPWFQSTNQTKTGSPMAHVLQRMLLKWWGSMRLANCRISVPPFRYNF